MEREKNAPEFARMLRVVANTQATLVCARLPWLPILSRISKNNAPGQGSTPSARFGWSQDYSRLSGLPAMRQGELQHQWNSCQGEGNESYLPGGEQASTADHGVLHA